MSPCMNAAAALVVAGAAKDLKEGAELAPQGACRAAPHGHGSTRLIAVSNA